jgi:hypothetical protein
MNNKLLLLVASINRIKQRKSYTDIFTIMNPQYDFFDILPTDQPSKIKILNNLRINDKLSLFDYYDNLIIKLKIIYVIDFGSTIFIQVHKDHDIDKYTPYVIDIEKKTIKQISLKPNIKIINF